MNTLSINTSTKQYSLAVMENETLLGEYILPSGQGRFNNLMLCIDDLLIKVDIGLDELGGLIIALGPGSFTGIRAGLAVAHGLSQCLNIPIIGIPTLLALASQLPFLKEDICSLVTSRRGEVFTALFRWNAQGTLSTLKQDTCLRIGELATMIENRTVFIGNDFPNQGSLLRQQLGQKHLLAPANLWNLKASSIGLLGLRRLKEEGSKSSGELTPIYVRGADIRLPKQGITVQ